MNMDSFAKFLVPGFLVCITAIIVVIFVWEICKFFLIDFHYRKQTIEDVKEYIMDSINDVMDFVDFDIAKKLKDKGFPQVKKGTLAMYNEEGEWYSLARNLDEFEYLFEDFDYHDCVCPTISQVLTWLRKEKKIYVSVEVEREDWFEYKIVQTIKNTRCNGTRVYKTYPEAILAGIEYVLDNLI